MVLGLLGLSACPFWVQGSAEQPFEAADKGVATAGAAVMVWRRRASITFAALSHMMRHPRRLDSCNSWHGPQDYCLPASLVNRKWGICPSIPVPLFQENLPIPAIASPLLEQTDGNLSALDAGVAHGEDHVFDDRLGQLDQRETLFDFNGSDDVAADA